MTANAIINTAEALRARIGAAIGGIDEVFPGSPVRDEVGESVVSLFMFHCSVNPELRNEQRFGPPPEFAPATAPSPQLESLPLDLLFLISVFRNPSDAPVPNELLTLGLIIRELHTNPVLDSETLGGQVVRVTPKPYPMEDLCRVWGLFPQHLYRTSIVYLATPVFVDSAGLPASPPVREREQHSGLPENPERVMETSEERAEREAEEVGR